MCSSPWMQVRNVTKFHMHALNVLKCLLYLEAVTWLSAYLIYSQKNTESAIKAVESWGWESTHQSWLHLAASHSSARTSNLQCTLPIWLGFWFSTVQIWRIPCFCTGNWKLHSSVTLSSPTPQAFGLGTLGPAPNHIFTLLNGSHWLHISAIIC